MGERLNQPVSAEAARALREMQARGQVYCVLDGARDPRIARMIVPGAPAWPLYRGDLPAAVAASAPYLLRLVPGHDYTERVMTQGWRGSWGILIASAAPVAQLRRHLRRFLRATLPGGAIVAFRYYDPRVLGPYLPSCTPREMACFFGPLQAIAFEAEEPGFHLFQKTAPGIAWLRLQADAAPARLVKTWPATLAKFPPLLWRIRARQLRIFQERADARYADQMLKLLRKQHPGEIAALSHDEVRTRCRDALSRASAYGLRGDEVLAFVTMTFTVAQHFDSHPRFQAVLADQAIAPGDKLAALYQRVPSGDWGAARGMR
jgi:hypothetical protein